MLLLETAQSFCSDTKDIWQFVGTIVTIFKIVIPVLIIILGSVDLGKAVVAGKEEDIKKHTNILIKTYGFFLFGSFPIKFHMQSLFYPTLSLKFNSTHYVYCHVK